MKQKQWVSKNYNLETSFDAESNLMEKKNIARIKAKKIGKKIVAGIFIVALGMSGKITVARPFDSQQVVVKAATTSNSSMKKEASSWAGTWKRTNVDRAAVGEIKITKVTKKKFDFTINVCNGGNTGDADGTATFKSNSSAIAKIDLWDGEYATFQFKLDKGNIKVTTKNADALGGMGTYFDGTYTKGKPVYLNDNIVDKTLGKSKTKVKKLLSNKDYKLLQMIMEDGSSFLTDLTYSGFVQGTGLGADLLIKTNGNIYCLIYELGSYRFYTTDKSYKNKVPKEFGALRSNDITYIVNTKIK